MNDERLESGMTGYHESFMQQVHFSSGVAHCQYCGEKVAVNRLSAHISKDHPRPIVGDMSPKLIRKPTR